MRKSEPKNILVISMQGFGDLLLFSPAFLCLKGSYPGSRISALVMKNRAGVVSGNPCIDEIIEYDQSKKSDLFMNITFLIILRKKRFDTVICAYPSGLRSAVIAYATGAGIRVGQALSFTNKLPFLLNVRVILSGIKHAIEMNMDLLKAIGVDTSRCPRKLQLPLAKEDTKYAEDLFLNDRIKKSDIVITVHPGVSEGGAHRSWGGNNYAELIDALDTELHARIILVGGPADRSLMTEIRNSIKTEPLVVSGISIKQMAAVFKLSTLFIGNNSGPMHIAASVGTPTVAIFGDTDPRIHGPYGNKSIIVRKELACSPCHYPFLHGAVKGAEPGKGFVNGKFICAEGDFKCMKLITVKDVLGAAKSLLRDIGRIQ